MLHESMAIFCIPCNYLVLFPKEGEMIEYTPMLVSLSKFPACVPTHGLER